MSNLRVIVHATVFGTVVLGLAACTGGSPRSATDRPLADDYRETPGARSERPGKHSTTAGRGGTSGEVGGGVDSQSGDEVVDSTDPVLERRQREERQERDR
jgi:hypothetical protein